MTENELRNNWFMNLCVFFFFSSLPRPSQSLMSCWLGNWEIRPHSVLLWQWSLVGANSIDQLGCVSLYLHLGGRVHVMPAKETLLASASSAVLLVQSGSDLFQRKHCLKLIFVFWRKEDCLERQSFPASARFDVAVLPGCLEKAETDWCPAWRGILG